MILIKVVAIIITIIIRVKGREGGKELCDRRGTGREAIRQEGKAWLKEKEREIV